MQTEGALLCKFSEVLEVVYPVYIIRCRNIKERDGIPNLLQGWFFDVHVFHVASYDFQVISGTEPFFVTGKVGVDRVLYAWRSGSFIRPCPRNVFDACAEEYQRYVFLAYVLNAMGMSAHREI